MNWYEEKREFHYIQWTLALGEEKLEAAKFHEREYLNYKKMVDERPNYKG